MTEVEGVSKMAELLKGPVKWFNDAKGFGFIEHKTGEDVFVHYSVIEWDGFKTLKDGEEVEYELKAGEKGLHAAVVRRPVALKKKLEKLETESRPTGDVAPNLQSGQLSSVYKSSDKMVEVETVASEDDDFLGSDSEIAPKAPVAEKTL